MMPEQSGVRRLRKLVCGGAPGGAAPYVTGRVRRRSGAQRTAIRPLKGSRKPLAPPGAPSLFFEGTEKRERAGPGRPKREFSGR